MASLNTARSVANLASYVQGRYGYGDFTGLAEAHLDTLKACVKQIDTLADLFFQTTSTSSYAPNSRFRGIGTTESRFCPPNVKGQIDTAWGATKWVTLHNQDGSYAKDNGPVIWLQPSIFAEGTGLFGEIGFTFARTPFEAIVHEFGHVVADLTPHAEVCLQRAVYGVYNSPRTSIGRDISIYTLTNAAEQNAELFTVLHTPLGLERLKSEAARLRIRTLARLTNQFLREGQAGYRLGMGVRGF